LEGWLDAKRSRGRRLAGWIGAASSGGADSLAGGPGRQAEAVARRRRRVMRANIERWIAVVSTRRPQRDASVALEVPLSGIPAAVVGGPGATGAGGRARRSAAEPRDGGFRGRGDPEAEESRWSV